MLWQARESVHPPAIDRNFSSTVRLGSIEDCWFLDRVRDYLEVDMTPCARIELKIDGMPGTCHSDDVVGETLTDRFSISIVAGECFNGASIAFD